MINKERKKCSVYQEIFEFLQFYYTARKKKGFLTCLEI